MQSDTAHARQPTCHAANTTRPYMSNDDVSANCAQTLNTLVRAQHHTNTNQDALHEHVQGSMPDKASFASKYQATLPSQPHLDTLATPTTSANLAQTATHQPNTGQDCGLPKMPH